jgi:mannose-6-phosphate isomerase-like protein (cupin superfamily)
MAFAARLSDIERQRISSGKTYKEFLRMPSLTAGLYVLPAHGLDLQKPHPEDELYYVIRGSARFQSGDDDLDVSAGSVIFVPAEVEHHFHEIAEELAALVLFTPKR